MKKRFSFVPTVIIALAAVVLISGSAVWLLTKFNFPDWITPLFSIAGVYAFFEVVSRLGPKNIETPTTMFLKLSVRDKSVLLIAFLVFLGVALPVRMFVDSRWLEFLFLALGFLGFWFICFFFGSKELMQRTSKNQN